MTEIQEEINKQYDEKLRVRVCGVLIEDEKLLLVHHRSLGAVNSLWAPPGGGMEYGESAEAALKREFKEEVNLEIEIEQFLFVHEYLDPPLHGMELFFLVKRTAGNLSLGIDPEMTKKNQLLTHAGFYALERLKPNKLGELHYVLQHVNSLEELINLKGYFKFH